MNTQKDLLEFLNNLSLLYSDLNRLVLEYQIEREWDTIASTTWHTKYEPFGILPHQKQIYLCIPATNVLHIYDENSEKITQNLSVNEPVGIDIDINKSRLYIAGKTHMTLLSLQNQNFDLSSWELPKGSTWTFRGIKSEGNIIYVTLWGLPQVFLCNSENGIILNKFGKEQSSSRQGEFDLPYGVTVVENFLYICESGNLRVQIVTKDNGVYISQFGGGKTVEFNHPYSIFYEELEKLFYIGDNFSVQIWERDTYTGRGQRIQLIGGMRGKKMNEFDGVFGICVMNDRLYVSDFNNCRIQIFRRKS